MKNVCEACRKTFAAGSGPAARADSPAALTGGGGEGIMMEEAPAPALFAGLCPRCRQEAWDAEVPAPPAYPYRH
jgi:hypothetical protein